MHNTITYPDKSCQPRCYIIALNLDSTFKETKILKSLGLSFKPVTGLGLVKAGFLIQLAFGEIGCIDSRNMEQFGINRNTLRYAKTTSKAIRLRKADNYIKLCASIGSCSFLWDNWCNELALNNPERYKSGHFVSAEHERLIKTA